MSATEQYARVLRDRVFGKPSSDNNWDACKHNWMRPDSIEWLEKMAERPARNRP